MLSKSSTSYYEMDETIRKVLEDWDALHLEELPKSVMVDLGRYLFGHKPALRFSYPAAGSFMSISVPGFVKIFKGMIYIARDQLNLDLLTEVDNDIFPHEILFGEMLGYPKCCVEKIANLGENFIDDYNDEFNKKVKRHSLLDISQYSNGIALISHVPCSMSCQSSLQQADQFYKSLEFATGSRDFCSWRDSVIYYFSSKCKGVG
ncbi:MAG: DUF483 domain-containing protein [Pseudomonadota bacterium]|jgi:hypothetical protein